MAHQKCEGGEGLSDGSHILGKTFRRQADTFVSFLVSKMKSGYRAEALSEE